MGGSRREKWRRHLLDSIEGMHEIHQSKNVEIVKMPGVEHAFPDEYIPQLRNWIREKSWG